MAVRYPAALAGMTTGALRQIQTTGATTNCGGAFSKQWVDSFQLNGSASFLRHNEPLGKFMTAIAQATTDVNEMTNALSAASRKMVEGAESANKSMLESSRKMRESSERLTVALTKFTAVFSNAKFAEQAKGAESLADSLERLAKLEESGMLTRVIAAMQRAP